MPHHLSLDTRNALALDILDRRLKVHELAGGVCGRHR